MLFHLPVTKTWLNQLTLSLTLVCHSSYRGVVELMRDILGVSISEGSVHNLHQVATGRAGAINRAQDLSPIRVGLHDEIFQGNQPVLAGVDANSTYCYLLAAEDHRDADTWAIHLLYAGDQGFNPDYMVADQGTGLRAGQAIVWEGKPCHGDVFHILHQCESLANVLGSVAQGATTRRQAMDLKMDVAKEFGCGNSRAVQLGLARHAEVQTCRLAKDIKTLTQWLRLTYWLWPARVWRLGLNCLTSSPPSWWHASTWTPSASARCVLHCKTSVTTCWHLLAYWTANWMPSPKTTISPCIWCARLVCSSANPIHPQRIGRAGADCGAQMGNKCRFCRIKQKARKLITTGSVSGQQFGYPWCAKISETG